MNVIHGFRHNMDSAIQQSIRLCLMSIEHGYIHTYRSALEVLMLHSFVLRIFFLLIIVFLYGDEFSWFMSIFYSEIFFFQAQLKSYLQSYQDLVLPLLFWPLAMLSCLTWVSSVG